MKQKIVLDNHLDTNNYAYEDTARLKYKGINVQLEFTRSFFAPNQFHMRLIGIRASSPLCKTKTGLGIGSTRLQIIAAYDGYHIDARPIFNYDNDKPVKSKTMSTVTVKEDEEGYAIIFNLVNNKVVSFEILPIYDDEE